MIRFFVLNGLKAKTIYKPHLQNAPPKTATTPEINKHNKTNTSYFAFRITYEKAVWKSSAAHVNNLTKTGSKTNFPA